MSAFEKWQVVVNIVQSAVLLATFLGALYIGLKQSDISVKQNEINQTLLDLNYSPSVEITYSDKRINIVNKGKTNLRTWGSQLNNGIRSIDKEGRLVTPGGSYYLFFEHVEQQLKKALEASDYVTVPFEVYFEAENGTKYVVRSLIGARTIGGKMEVFTQTFGNLKSDWSKAQ